MYPSGSWAGFWQQPGWGRQPMQAFELHFQRGVVRGGGSDVVGKFTFTGEYDGDSGSVTLVKRYVNAHRVEYVGKPDGEGCILGTWRLDWHDQELTGPFLMKPNLPRPSGGEAIREIRKGERPV